MKAAKGRTGFTLMELLAAVTLMVILGTMLFTVFKNSSLVVRDASGRQLVFQQAKLFMDHIEREASGAYWTKQSRASQMRPFLIANNGQSVAMVTAAKVRDTRGDSPTFGTEANLGRVGYYLQGNTLYRFEYYTLYGSGDDAAEVARAVPFLNNVVSFTVECYDNGAFNITNWNSSAGVLPKAIRITLRLTDDRHLRDYLDMSNDKNGDGVVSRDEAGDDIGQTFEHVAYLGSRSW
jgi:type II secretion system protein J